MKKIFILLIIPVLLSSCSDWLDVKPKAEIKLDVMFETEQGFKDALIGCYLLLSGRSLYGAEMTCTFMDVLSQQYAHLGTTSGRYEPASRYLYTSSVCETSINGIWSGMYNVIANLNAIIAGLENSKDRLHPTIYALIKAEAYSLRAFIYLDLVRLFTWGNISERTEKLDLLAIPYAKEYDKHIIKQSKLSEVLTYIHQDLEIALNLFDIYDPWSVSGKRPDDYSLPNDDKFFDNTVRPYRMNIKGAMATRMRLNMWEGNYDKAMEDALFLIEKIKTPWASKLDEEEKSRDLTLSAEMLFGVQTYERFEKTVKSYFKLTAVDDLNMNYSALYLPKARVEEIYEIGSNIGASDVRYARWWDKAQNNYAFVKFWEKDESVHKDKMPIIKKSELYYTVAECCLRRQTEEGKVTAINYLNDVRNARNIPFSLNIQTSISIEDAWSELYKEWRKEAIGDGQMFYYYKRHGYNSIPSGPALQYGDNVYVLPLPQREIDFGNREQLVETK